MVAKGPITGGPKVCWGEDRFDDFFAREILPRFSS
jgi:hypothetical protein